MLHCFPFFIFISFFLPTPCRQVWMSHLPITVDLGQRYLLPNRSFHRLTCISILPIAVRGRPATNIQVNCSETNPTLCVCSMSLLSFNRSIDLDETGRVSFTNFCLCLVVGKVWFEYILGRGQSQLTLQLCMISRCLILFLLLARARSANAEVESVCLCSSRLQLSHHYPTSTWRSASEEQRARATAAAFSHFELSAITPDLRGGRGGKK